MKSNINKTDNYLVCKSNQLIEARYRLSLQQQRLILVLASHIHPDDGDFDEYTCNVRDLCRMIGLEEGSEQSYYTELQKITMDLIEKGLKIKEGDKLIQTAWLAGARYHNGKISMTFSRYLKPYLLQLKESFTKYQLRYVMTLKSRYAVRLYELMKKNELLGHYYYDLSTLRDMLGVGDNELTKWSHFRTRALDKAVMEINSKTDLTITYAVRKDNKKIIGVTFTITPNDGYNADGYSTASLDSPITELVTLLPDRYQKAKSTINMLIHAYHKHGFEYCKRNILYSNEKAHINYSSFLSMALQNDWGLLYEDEQDMPLSTPMYPDNPHKLLYETQQNIATIIQSMSPEELEAKKQEIIQEKQLHLLFGPNIPDLAWQVFLSGPASDNRA